MPHYQLFLLILFNKRGAELQVAAESEESHHHEEDGTPLLYLSSELSVFVSLCPVQHTALDPAWTGLDRTGPDRTGLRLTDL